MRPKDAMLADSTTIRRLYRRPGPLTDEQMTAVRVAMDVVDLLTEIERLRAAVGYFLTEDWSHITDAETLCEIAEDVARKDRRKWGVLNMELQARDEDIQDLETVLAGGQMTVCEQNADIALFRATIKELRDAIT